MSLLLTAVRLHGRLHVVEGNRRPYALMADRQPVDYLDTLASAIRT